MRIVRNLGMALAFLLLLAFAQGCTRVNVGYRPYYEGVNVSSPWYGYPYGPPGYYPSPVHLGGRRPGGRYN